MSELKKQILKMSHLKESREEVENINNILDFEATLNRVFSSLRRELVSLSNSISSRGGFYYDAYSKSPKEKEKIEKQKQELLKDYGKKIEEYLDSVYDLVDEYFVLDNQDDDEEEDEEDDDVVSHSSFYKDDYEDEDEDEE